MNDEGSKELLRPRTSVGAGEDLRDGGPAGDPAVRLADAANLAFGKCGNDFGKIWRVNFRKILTNSIILEDSLTGIKATLPNVLPNVWQIVC